MARTRRRPGDAGGVRRRNPRGEDRVLERPDGRLRVAAFRGRDVGGRARARRMRRLHGRRRRRLRACRSGGGGGGPHLVDLGDPGRMSTEENIAVVRRYLQLFEQDDAQRFEEVIHEELVAYYPDGSLAFQGREAWIDSERERTTRDVRVTAEDVVAAGDKVACRYRIEGTLPEGRRLVGSGTKIYRLRDGKIVEIAGHDHSDTFDS